MSFNKHRHVEYTSKSRHHFQNSISKIGGPAARDAYFAPIHRQKSPEFGGSAAGACSGYSEQETELEIDDLRSVRCHERNYDKELYNSRSKHDYHHHYKEYSPERSSRVYQHPRKGSCEEYHSSLRTLHTTSQKVIHLTGPRTTDFNHIQEIITEVGIPPLKMKTIIIGLHQGLLTGMIQEDVRLQNPTAENSSTSR